MGDEQAEALGVGVLREQRERGGEPVRGGRGQRLVGGEAGVAQDGDGLQVAEAREALDVVRAGRGGRSGRGECAAARSWAPSRQPPGAAS